MTEESFLHISSVARREFFLFTSGRISLFTPQKDGGSKARGQAKGIEILWKTEFLKETVGGKTWKAAVKLLSL